MSDMSLNDKLWELARDLGQLTSEIETVDREMTYLGTKTGSMTTYEDAEYEKFTKLNNQYRDLVNRRDNVLNAIIAFGRMSHNG